MPVTPPPPCVALLAWYRPGDRRAEVGVAGRGPHVEHLVGRELAVKDVAADEAVLVFHLVRPDHLPVQDRRREAGRDRLDAGDDPIGVRVELALDPVRSRTCAAPTA